MFSHGSKIYYGLRKQDDYREFYSHDVVTGASEKLPVFPGTAVTNFTSFKVGNSGYIIGGKLMYGSFGASNQIWKYNITTRQWTSEGSLAFGARADATAINAGGKVFVGLGRRLLIINGQNINFEKDDWWEYNPTSNSWTQKTSFPGGARVNAKAYYISNKAYIGFGQNSSGSNVNDMWSYGPINNTWIQQTSWGGTYNTSLGTFQLGNNGYLIKGNFQQFSKYATPSN
jgi:N-acetylneuraminic acid mutarotase